MKRFFVPDEEFLIPMLGLTLQSLRQERNMTQPQLEKLTGIGYRTISNIERGYRTHALLVTHVAKFCEAFGITLSDFFARVEQNILQAKAPKRRSYEI